MNNNPWNKGQRQPPKAVFYTLYKILLGVLKNVWPLILIMLFRSRKPESDKDTIWTAISIGISVFIFAMSWINYWFFKFYIEEEQKLIIEKGLLRKQKLSIPLRNIQAVHLKQTWLHRLLNLTELLIDSPGTNSAETKITLNNEQAAELKSYIFDLKGQAENEQEAEATPRAQPDTPYQEETLLFGLDPIDLIKLGFSANHFRAFLILIAFAYGFLQNIRQASETYYSDASHKLFELFFGNTMKGIVMVGLIVVLISILISFIRVIMRYANFRITKRYNGFSVRTGMIEIKEKVISLKKIQYVKWSANWLREKMHLYELQFVAIGEVEKEDMKVKIPVTQTEYLYPLIANYGMPLKGSDNVIRVSKKYFLFKLIRFVLIPAFILIGLSFWEISFLWGLFILVYFAIGYRLFLRKAALFLDDDIIQISKGNFGVEEYLLKWRKIQSVQIKQTIYQRRHELATIVFSTATGKTAMPFIRLSDAQVLADIALYKIESNDN